jgi:hypothetical protein
MSIVEAQTQHAGAGMPWRTNQILPFHASLD